IRRPHDRGDPHDQDHRRPGPLPVPGVHQYPGPPATGGGRAGVVVVVGNVGDEVVGTRLAGVVGVAVVAVGRLSRPVVGRGVGPAVGTAPARALPADLHRGPPAAPTAANTAVYTWMPQYL